MTRQAARQWKVSKVNNVHVREIKKATTKATTRLTQLDEQLYR